MGIVCGGWACVVEDIDKEFRRKFIELEIHMSILFVCQPNTERIVFSNVFGR